MKRQASLDAFFGNSNAKKRKIISNEDASGLPCEEEDVDNSLPLKNGMDVLEKVPVTSSYADFMTIEPVWREVLRSEFDQAYFQNLMKFLASEKAAKQVLYPPAAEVYSAFNLCPFDKVTVLILGQDPYHGPGQAHGLAFSVKRGVPQPPSLKNMVKLAVSDVGIKPTTRGSLEPWAKQGVLLLNTVLTVRHKAANSHKDRGWETFTDAAIKAVAAGRNNVVFILWGKPAQLKAKLIDSKRHLILEAVHPSPLSAHRGFFTCEHYSKTNAYLVSKGLPPIDWNL